MPAGILRDRFFLGFMALLTVLVVPLFLPFWTEAQLGYYFGLYAHVPPLATLLIGLLLASRQATRPRERLFFLLLSLAHLAWLILRLGDIVVSDELFASVPYSLWSDSWYLGFYLCLALALQMQPYRASPLSAWGRLQRLSAASQVVLGVGLLAYFAVIPGHLQPDHYFSGLPSMKLYVVLDVYLLGWCSWTLANCRTQPFRRVHGLLLLTFALYLTTDVLEALDYSEVLPTEAGGWTEVLYFLPYATTLLAARAFQRARPGPSRSANIVLPAPTATKASSVALVSLLALPAVHMTLLLGEPWEADLQAARTGCVLLTCAALAALAIAHQRLLIEQNRRLEREQRRFKQQLQLSRTMEAVGRLAGGIAHDFNNLLQVISGSCELLRKADHRDSRPFLHEIEAATTHAVELTHHLMALGTERSLHPRELDIDALLRGLLPMLKRLCGEGVLVSLHTGAPGVRVFLDPSPFEHAILNLVSNACDALGGTGSVGISTRLDPQSSQHLLVEVEDDGPGIPPGIRERVFEPFYTTKNVGQGTGLGLSMAYQFALQSGGSIQLTRAAGGGACFTLRFPVRSEPPPLEAPPPTRGSSQARTPRRLVLAEDDGSVRRALQHLLVHAGFEVITAGDGQEALELLHEATPPIDLLVTDLVMPRMSGTALIAAARRELPDLPVLALTGYPRGEGEAGGLPEDLPVLEKPVTGQKLLDAIERLFPVERVVDAR